MLEIIILLTVYVVLIFVEPTGLSMYLLLFTMFALFIPSIRALRNGPPFVPTGRKRMRQMIAFADPKPGERAYDLGCGDGRLVRGTARLGAIAIGYELSTPTFVLARILSIGKPRVTILFKDFWFQDYRDADIVYCYLLQSLMPRFEREIWPQLKSGTRVVSHAFTMPGATPAAKQEGVCLYLKD